MSRVGVSLTVIVGLVSVLGGCSDEEVDLVASVGLVDARCPRPPSDGSPPETWPVRSIRVTLIEWSGGVPGVVLDDECIGDIEGLDIASPRELLDWFDQRGYVLREIPGERATKVRIIGYFNDRCQAAAEPFGALICGLTEGVLSESTYAEEDAVRFAFYCAARDAALAFFYCLGVDEAR